MTELEIDQTHLPRVQEVCHVFAVLEDGALAHNLQEQEIEQYYTTNMQKNQLVQNDIRIAKRLQNEERAQHTALLSQASRQLQEEDSEYARMIQEEILRCADEEAQRREQEDEEMAKRIQEEEELRVRQRRSRQESLSDGAALQPEKGACLDLGELQQVLLDEELARRLQEEEKLLRRSPQARPSHYQRDSFPAGDFRVAQVAQDEEIARFMQKQEMKSKRRSRDLDGPGSRREPHDLADPYDRRTARERQFTVLCLRSSGRDWTQRTFHLLLKTALQTIRPLDPQPNHNSQSETLQRNWTQLSRPVDKARRASEQDRQSLAHPPASLITLLTPAYMTLWRSQRSSHPPRGKAPNLYAPNPKRRRRTVSSSDVSLRPWARGYNRTPITLPGCKRI
ncbi:coiled-coil domain-containing protein 50 isoform X1 [Salmo trutta]|uniref:coiled-coil domain-containing protein 50 isoform X1 n=1 Tax=Salmo trutta TaxID=8032 RepID=UPI001131C31A|nr:coiled-coil domain-containing protein 50-like isoform X1 [Salmo trutta]XP_029578866.1 coiled-coil domain-containing protein 50-like isoform X1 [Salmo trutta]